MGSGHTTQLLPLTYPKLTAVWSWDLYLASFLAILLFFDIKMPLKKYIGRGLGAKSNPIKPELFFPQWNNCARRTMGLPCPAWDTAWRWESAHSLNSTVEESSIMWAAQSCRHVVRCFESFLGHLGRRTHSSGSDQFEPCQNWNRAIFKAELLDDQETFKVKKKKACLSQNLCQRHPCLAAPEWGFPRSQLWTLPQTTYKWKSQTKEALQLVLLSASKPVISTSSRQSALFSGLAQNSIGMIGHGEFWT